MTKVITSTTHSLHRMVIRTSKPSLGRKVIVFSSAMVSSSMAGSASSKWKWVTSCKAIWRSSINARFIPIQFRGPYAKGAKAKSDEFTPPPAKMAGDARGLLLGKLLCALVVLLSGSSRSTSSSLLAVHSDQRAFWNHYNVTVTSRLHLLPASGQLRQVYRDALWSFYLPVGHRGRGGEFPHRLFDHCLKVHRNRLWAPYCTGAP
eukprot:CAMPEP_0170090132 /NCGR_PEP_ID=MMETSP0019_2-20121128/24028_1 /TAXON_ID=98059 /ORGANISM="Dinobryon sp., Strain UTEXLB2267" /LENGTH=204 /DNA_ID=CAMNT_0010309313 /DNA_START=60 /DNA_END=674 /DNA_ORIENTATION=+